MLAAVALALGSMSPPCQALELVPSDAVGGEGFGIAVSVSGRTAVVGAWTDAHAGPNNGSAYVFERSVAGGSSAHCLRVPA
jgi:hypothetical protein